MVSTERDRDMKAALVIINYALTAIAHSGKKVTSQDLALALKGEAFEPTEAQNFDYIRTR